MATPVLYGIEIESFNVPPALHGVEVEFNNPPPVLHGITIDLYAGSGGKTQRFCAGSKIKSMQAGVKTKEFDN